jgi:hypothetical protein
MDTLIEEETINYIQTINYINFSSPSLIWNKSLLNNELEFLIFQFSDNLVNLKYSNIVRECANLIKQDADISKSFLNGYLSSKDLLSKVIDS